MQSCLQAMPVLQLSWTAAQAAAPPFWCWPATALCRIRILRTEDCGVP